MLINPEAEQGRGSPAPSQHSAGPSTFIIYDDRFRCEPRFSRALLLYHSQHEHYHEVKENNKDEKRDNYVPHRQHPQHSAYSSEWSDTISLLPPDGRDIKNRNKLAFGFGFDDIL